MVTDPLPTETRVVPAAIPVPETEEPATILVVVMFVSVVTPAAKSALRVVSEKTRLVLVEAVAAWLRVIVPLPIEAMVVLLGIPVPDTGWPAISPVVVILLTVVLPAVMSPVADKVQVI